MSPSHDLVTREQAEPAAELLDPERAALLDQAARELFICTNSNQVFDTVVKMARQLVKADGYAAWRGGAKGSWKLVASSGLSQKFVADGYVQSFPVTDLPWNVMVYQDVEKEQFLVNRTPSLLKEGVHAVVAVPLRARGQATGALSLYNHAKNSFSASDVYIASLLGHVASAAIGTADIVERRVSELELITDTLPALISYFDTDQRFLRVNKAYEIFFGKAEQEIVGRTIKEITGPEHYANAKAKIEQALNGEPVIYRSKVRRCDRTIRDIQLSYTPDFDQSGNVTGVVALIQDITDSDTADQTRARLAAIVESSDDVIISKTLDGRITSWNQGAERIFGYTAEEAIGQPITMIIPHDRLREEEEVLARIARGEGVHHFETVRIRKDGRFVNVSLTVSPMRNAEGKVFGASKIARDITDRVESQRQMTQLLWREQEARRTAELLNQIGPALTGELDPQKLTQIITDLATGAVGAEFGALFHNAVNEAGESYVLYTLSGVPREAFEKFPMPRNTEVFGPTFRGTGPVRSDDITKDPRYGKNAPYHGMPEGHLPVCSYLAVPVVSRTGEVLGGIFFGHSRPAKFNLESEQIAMGIAAQAAIALDNATLLSESQRAQQALKSANGNLMRANDDLQQFAHSASHDLQEPLRMVSIYAELLQRKEILNLDREAQEYLAHVRRGAAQMEALVRGLLEYTQASLVDQSSLPLTPVGEALEDALAILRASIEASAAVIHYPDQLPSVRVIRIHLSQLFQNLIGNAIKYRNVLQPPEIHVFMEREADHWLFSVSDNGIGIESEYKEQVFGIFKRLHTGDQYSGTGIGLAICRRIVDRAGGRMWVESEFGKGSTFYFTLPDAGE